MSTLTKLRLTYFCTFAIGALMGVVLISTQSRFAEWFMFAWVLVGSTLIWRIRCPNCDKPAYHTGKLLGFQMRSMFGAKICTGCGLDLTKSKQGS